MEVRVVTAAGVERRPPSSLDGALRGHPPIGGGPIWVDIPVGDEEAGNTLSATFGFHPSAVEDCARRNRVPRVDVYRDHVFVVLHAPELGAGGHVHFVEIDQFIAAHYLVTVHGPVNPAVDPAVAHRETDAVLARLTSGQLRPSSGFELSHAIVCAVIGGQEQHVESLTREVWNLEQQVTGGHLCDPEHLLDELFRVRHGLLAIRTMSASGRDVYTRIAQLPTVVPDTARTLAGDVADRFERVRAQADVQREYLQGVIDFFRARTETKMTIAAERLAVIAAVTLPVTALSSVLGMNLIVNGHTQALPLAAAITVMAVMSATVLLWARRRGWF